MDQWEYCEMYNLKGSVEIRYLSQEGDGCVIQTVEEKKTHNMAKALARLGAQGWEVVAIYPGYGSTPIIGGYEYAPHSLTAYNRESVAFLKRRIEEPHASGEA